MEDDSELTMSQFADVLATNTATTGTTHTPSLPSGDTSHVPSRDASPASDISASCPPVPSSFMPSDPSASLPIANVSRIMKAALPSKAKIGRDAKDCVQLCTQELIAFVTSEASDRCAAEKRKTINGDDVLYALRVLGFDDYEEVLRVFLTRYRSTLDENPSLRRVRNPPAASNATRDIAADSDNHPQEPKRRGRGRPPKTPRGPTSTQALPASSSQSEAPALTPFQKE